MKAVIYSHWHIDHYAGVAAFATPEQAASGEVKIIAHKTFLANMIKNSTGGTGPIIGARVDYSLGTLLDRDATGRINGGLGPDFVIENPSLIAPNVLVDDVLHTTIAGVEMEIKWVPSEAPDEIAVWLPELELLHTVEVIQGESFPNLHTIRGTRYRDPELWFTGIDTLREYPAKYMVPSHGRPVSVARPEEPPKPKPSKNPEPKKPEADPPPRPTPTAAPPAQPDETSGPTGDGAGGPAEVGIAGLEGDEFAWYRLRVKNAIQVKWRRPFLQGMRDSIQVSVVFVIQRDGSVTGLAIDVPSGVAALDRSAQRAVYEAALPALPRNWDEPTADARFVFRLFPEEF